jgi:hypothetical protein
MTVNRSILAFACVCIASCTAQEDDRRSMLEANGRLNYAIAGRAGIGDLRGQRDSGSVIYHQPVDLSRRSASDAGAQQVWAPFGIAKPDTLTQQQAR